MGSVMAGAAAGAGRAPGLRVGGDLAARAGGAGVRAGRGGVRGRGGGVRQRGPGAGRGRRLGCRRGRCPRDAGAVACGSSVRAGGGRPGRPPGPRRPGVTCGFAPGAWPGRPGCWWLGGVGPQPVRSARARAGPGPVPGWVWWRGCGASRCAPVPVVPFAWNIRLLGKLVVVLAARIFHEGRIFHDVFRMPEDGERILVPAEPPGPVKRPGPVRRPGPGPAPRPDCARGGPRDRGKPNLRWP